MSAGMAGVVAAHQSIWECTGSYEDDRAWLECSCRESVANDKDCWTGDTETEHAAHVAEELAKAGYGNVREAKAAVAAVEWVCDNNSGEVTTVADGDHVPIYLIRAAIKNAAALAGPEGHALVKAIHDRKAEGPPDHALWCRGGHEGPCKRGRASGTET